MASYSVAHAKAQLSKLIDAALRGENVTITRHSKPVVEMVTIEKPKPPKPDEEAIAAARRRIEDALDLLDQRKIRSNISIEEWRDIARRED